jgi:hypothetical protein
MWYRVGPRYKGKGDSVSIIANVHYNRVKGYSRKYIIGYTANTPNTYLYAEVLINYLLESMSQNFQLNRKGKIHDIQICVCDCGHNNGESIWFHRCVQQRIRSVLHLNHENEVCMKQEYTDTYIYWVHKTMCI